MIPTRTPSPTYQKRARDARREGRRFWVDLVLACLAGIVLALTVAAVSSQGAW